MNGNMNVRTSGVFVFYLCTTPFSGPHQYMRVLPLPPLTGSSPSPAIHYLQLLQVHRSTSFPAWLFISACLAVKMKALQSFEKLGTTHPTTRHHHILEDSILEYILMAFLPLQYVSSLESVCSFAP